MIDTPLAERVRIVLAGVRNSGKSALFNRLCEHDISIVSSKPGTTGDPVTKGIEMGALGPVALVDTAGFDDDEDEVGSLRTGKTHGALALADAVVLVSRRDTPPSEEERSFATRMVPGKKPFLLILTFGDRPADEEKLSWAAPFAPLTVANPSGEGVGTLRQRLESLAAHLEPERDPLEGLVSSGDTVVLVTPIDASAPKRRLILPQVEVLRDLLDRHCAAVVVQVPELAGAYGALTHRPQLVITDSQAFAEVASILPQDQPLTSFSILFARKKGDLDIFIEGLHAMGAMPPSCRVLILEACAHHRQDDDIGTVKIPALFRKLVCSGATFDFARELPPDLNEKSYDLVIHCAGCMVTRRQMLLRLERLRQVGIPSLNYGVFLAWAKGLIPRALEPLLPELAALPRDPEEGAPTLPEKGSAGA